MMHNFLVYTATQKHICNHFTSISSIKLVPLATQRNLGRCIFIVRELWLQRKEFISCFPTTHFYISLSTTPLVTAWKQPIFRPIPWAHFRLKDKSPQGIFCSSIKHLFLLLSLQPTDLDEIRWKPFTRHWAVLSNAIGTQGRVEKWINVHHMCHNSILFGRIRCQWATWLGTYTPNSRLK